MKSMLLILAVLLVFGCTTQEANGNQNNTPPVVQNQTGLQNQTIDPAIGLTLDEVAKHNTMENCLLIIDNNVYNIPSSFASQHPGGEAYVQYCGGDATTAFTSKGGTGHSENATNKLNDFLIAPLR
ncbi:MAG: cytochrome b5-like heme/steroid binding domain-containing protein [Candidatus Micrarchaeota archaeon]